MTTLPAAPTAPTPEFADDVRELNASIRRAELWLGELRERQEVARRRLARLREQRTRLLDRRDAAFVDEVLGDGLRLVRDADPNAPAADERPADDEPPTDETDVEFGARVAREAREEVEEAKSDLALVIAAARRNRHHLQPPQVVTANADFNGLRLVTDAEHVAMNDIAGDPDDPAQHAS